MNLNLTRSAIWAVVEVAVTGLSLFLLYKFVVLTLGIKALGIWSLVMATTSLARFADIGAAAGLSRFIALSRANNDLPRASRYASTALIANGALFIAIGGLIVWPAGWGLQKLSPADSLSEALQLLPYAIVSFILLNVSAVTLSSIIGLQRADLKSKIVILSTTIQVFVALLLVPKVGLVGMAWGQIAQYSITIVASLTFFGKLVKTPELTFQFKFDRVLFREMFAFGAKLQAANLMFFMFEPSIKFVMSAIAGLEALGLYEMAYRMVMQIRHLVVSPMQQLVPAFAHLEQVSAGEVNRLYNTAVSSALIFGIPLFMTLSFASPILGRLWVGSYRPDFTWFTLLLCIGWLCNLVAAPAYQLGISRGSTRWNILGQFIISLVGPAAGLILGSFAGQLGVAAGASLGLAVGSLLAMILNCRDARVEIFPSLARIRSVYRNYHISMRRSLGTLAR